MRPNIAKPRAGLAAKPLPVAVKQPRAPAAADAHMTPQQQEARLLAEVTRIVAQFAGSCTFNELAQTLQAGGFQYAGLFGSLKWMVEAFAHTLAIEGVPPLERVVLRSQRNGGAATAARVREQIHTPEIYALEVQAVRIVASMGGDCSFRVLAQAMDDAKQPYCTFFGSIEAFVAYVKHVFVVEEVDRVRLVQQGSGVLPVNVAPTPQQTAVMRTLVDVVTSLGGVCNVKA